MAIMSKPMRRWPLLLLLLALLAGCNGKSPSARQLSTELVRVLPAGPVTAPSGSSKVITENDLRQDANLTAVLGINTIVASLAHPDNLTVQGLGKKQGQTCVPIQVPAEGDYSFAFEDPDGHKHAMRLVSGAGAQVFRVQVGEGRKSVHLPR